MSLPPVYTNALAMVPSVARGDTPMEHHSAQLGWLVSLLKPGGLVALLPWGPCACPFPGWLVQVPSPVCPPDSAVSVFRGLAASLTSSVSSFCARVMEFL